MQYYNVLPLQNPLAKIALNKIYFGSIISMNVMCNLNYHENFFTLQFTNAFLKMTRISTTMI